MSPPSAPRHACLCSLTHSDHSYYEPSSKTLFLSAKNLDHVFVLDAANGGKVVDAIAVSQPQGLAVSSGKLFVGSDSGGPLSVFDASTHAFISALNFSTAAGAGEVDDLLVDPSTGNVLASCGDDADGSADPSLIAVVDSNALKVLSTTSSGGAHVEGFALEPPSAGTRVWASTPDNGHVLLLDLATSSRVRTLTVPAPFGGCTPLSFVAADERVLLACRAPAEFVVLDVSAAGRGRAVFSHPIVEDADDMKVNPATGAVYISGGGNATQPARVDVFARVDASRYHYIGSVSPAGKNCEADFAGGTLYVTVLGTAGQAAFVQLYSL